MCWIMEKQLNCFYTLCKSICFGVYYYIKNKFKILLYAMSDARFSIQNNEYNL